MPAYPENIPELLAPAGSFDALIAAVSAGADAVYLGGKIFGARHFAQNFDDEELKDAIGYAHLRGVKIYVTVNVLFHDSEFDAAREYIINLYKWGADAVLIQDIGFLTYIKKILPELEIHASTQMGIHNRAGAALAQKYGCTRIVLARELNIESLKRIYQEIHESGLQLEIFSHGALCYGFSGYCLMSAFIGGRSGNRGMCAQPCRKKYALIKGFPDKYGRLTKKKIIHLDEDYLLSTRDLCLYPVLNTITSLPVASLKIEGRMRTPFFVGTVISIYRNALDKIRTGSFSPKLEDINDLKLAFSRDFTTGYINNNPPSEIMGRKHPGNQGVFWGTITGSSNGGLYQLLPVSDISVEPGDGVVFRNNYSDIGFIIKESPYSSQGLVYLKGPQGVFKGAQCWITSRKNLSKKFERLMKEPDIRFYGERKLRVNLTIDNSGSIKVEGFISDGKERTVPFSYQTENKLVPAEKRPLSSLQIQEQLNKTGKTLFYFDKIEINYNGGLFAPIKILNEIRRELLTKASSAYISSYQPDTHAIQDENNLPLKKTPSQREKIVTINNEEPDLVLLVSSIEDASIVAGEGADLIFIEWYPELGIEKIIQLIIQFKDLEFGILVPKIILDNELDLLISFLQESYSKGLRHIMIDSIGIAEYLMGIFPEILWYGFTGLNLTNSHALDAYSHFSLLTLSQELSGEEIQTILESGVYLKKTKIATFVQGFLESMVTKDPLVTLCQDDTKKKDSSFIYAIQDEQGEIFPVYSDFSGRTHIYNSVELSLYDQIYPLYQAGVSCFIIDARHRGIEYSKRMTALYCTLIKSGNKITKNDIKRIKEEIQTISWNGITSGGYRRGLCR